MTKAKPCSRCGQAPKEPGSGKRYCTPCREFTTLSVADRARVRNREANEIARRRAGVKRAKKRDAPEGTKWCARCAQYLVYAMFSPNKGKGGRLSSYCSDCSKSVYHGLRLKNVYGITADQYYEILERQGGVCAICHMKPKSKKLAVDHDHKTGLIRGLLCSQCNSRVLASLRDSVESLRRAIEYLENPPARGIADAPVPDRPGS